MNNLYVGIFFFFWYNDDVYSNYWMKSIDLNDEKQFILLAIHYWLEFIIDHGQIIWFFCFFFFAFLSSFYYYIYGFLLFSDWMIIFVVFFFSYHHISCIHNSKLIIFIFNWLNQIKSNQKKFFIIEMKFNNDI